jgi:hypothetical protein
MIVSTPYLPVVALRNPEEEASSLQSTLSEPQLIVILT